MDSFVQLQTLLDLFNDTQLGALLFFSVSCGR